MKISKNYAKQYFNITLFVVLFSFIYNAILVNLGIISKVENIYVMVGTFIYLWIFFNLFCYCYIFFSDKKQTNYYVQAKYFVFNFILLFFINDLTYSSTLLVNIHPTYNAFLGLIVVISFVWKYKTKFEYLPQEYLKYYQISAISGVIITFIMLVLMQKWLIKFEHVKLDLLIKHISLRFILISLANLFALSFLLNKSKQKMMNNVWVWYYFNVIMLFCLCVVYGVMFNSYYYLILAIILICGSLIFNYYTINKIKAK